MQPPDLTRLAQRTGGSFPMAAVSHAIAGEDRAHSDMPAWLAQFRAQAGEPPDDAAARRKVEALTLYLEFIQYRPRR